MARPTKFEAERCERILKALRAGCTRKAASAAGGIDFKTFLSWESRYPSFSTDIEIAENQAEFEFTNIVAVAASNGDARMAIEWLKRRRRDDWGDSAKTEISGALTVTKKAAELTDDELAAVLDENT